VLIHTKPSEWRSMRARSRQRPIEHILKRSGKGQRRAGDHEAAREALGLEKRFGEIAERGPIKLFNAIRAAQKVRKWAGL